MRKNTTMIHGVNVFEINRLHWLAVMSYIYPAPYKTGAGISTPKLIKATPDAASVFFCVRHMRHFMAWCVISLQGLRCQPCGLLSHHAAHNGAMCTSLDEVGSQSLSLPRRTSHRQTMVALAGQPQGWPVPFIAGSANPVNVTAHLEISTSSGDSLNQIKEAANMATSSRLNLLDHNLSASAPLFVWRFWSCQQSRYITSTATSEREARLQLPAVHLVFVARIRVEGVNHA